MSGKRNPLNDNGKNPNARYHNGNIELSKQGYNAFALIYRPGAQTACEDLSRAIAFIFENDLKFLYKIASRGDNSDIRRCESMVEPDTIKLLRECDAGIQMGVKSISDVLDNVKDARMKEMLEKCKDKHDALQDEIDKLLQEYHDEGKEPNVMAQGMSWIKTNVKLAMDDSDTTIAELMTDGCDMGIKSLSRYLNQYKAADDKAKAITKKLINLENDLCSGLREYL